MILEIIQIKRWLSGKFNLRTQGDGMDLRVLDPVPDGEYKIPIGRRLTLTRVVIEGGKILIDPKP